MSWRLPMGVGTMVSTGLGRVQHKETRASERNSKGAGTERMKAG
jgi:hypothetical protein